MDEYVKKDDVIQAGWKALFEYEDKTEKQFQESADLDVSDWFLHRIFVQNMHAAYHEAVQNLPAADIRAFLISPVGLMVGDPVWLEVFSHGDGKYCVFPGEVKWIEEDGLCVLDEHSCGHYCKIDDFNEGHKRATFGWRCWNECPTPKRMEAIPWNE